MDPQASDLMTKSLERSSAGDPRAKTIIVAAAVAIVYLTLWPLPHFDINFWYAP